MATIASNQLAIYFLDSLQTSPMAVASPTVTLFSSSETGFEDSDFYGAPVGSYFINPTGDGTYFGGVYQQPSSGLNIANKSSEFKLVAAATTTTLDTSNAVNEVSARTSTGTSANYIASGAFSWNFSVDGLIDMTGGSGSSIDIIDISKASKYVLVKFTTDINGGTNEVTYVGQGLVESASMTGGVDDIATYSATFRGYGPLFKEI